MAYTPITSDVRSLRADIGDVAAPLILGYSEMASLYDRAAGDYNTTVVYLLQRFMARLTSMYAACETKDARIALQKRIDASKAALEFWKLEAGIFGGSLRTGVLALELDYDDEELQ